MSVSVAMNTYYTFFIEVPPGLPLLEVDLFDADVGEGGNSDIYDRRDGGWNTDVAYTLFDPTGTQATTLLADKSTPANSDSVWINFFTTLNPTPGHWELRVDTSAAVTTGNDYIGYSVRAHDGDPTAGGTEINIYAQSFVQFGIHAGAPVTWTLHPYLDAGGSPGFGANSNDFDLDAAGAITFNSRTNAFNFPTPAVSGSTVWQTEPFTGWTSDYAANEYGIWTLDVEVQAPSNYVTYYLSDWTAAVAPPTAQPEPGTYRIYLQDDAGGAPAKPWVTQVLSWMAGPNPPLNGSSTTIRIIVTVTNPTPFDITFSPTELVTTHIPGIDVAFAGNETVSQGVILSTPLLSAPGDLMWNPGVIAGGTSAVLSYDVLANPNAPGQRIELTGNPGANGTTAVFLDETGNVSQARAHFTFGPLSELAVTEGSLVPGDSDGDGIPDTIEGAVDTDGDGEANFVDLDSDNDGIDDTIEGTVDTDGDLIPDYLDPDSDGDGVWDLIEGNDLNADGITDYLLIDANNDGMIDVLVDVNRNGLDDAYDFAMGGVAAVRQNSDLDSIPDLRDPDDDGDGIPTADEDGNMNGDWADDNPDGDNFPAYLDLDADGDGILDATEGIADPDGDGVGSFLDLDADNDGAPDVVEGSADDDGDSVPAYLDLDSDNDGVPDTIESGAFDFNRDGRIDLFSDTNGNGLADRRDPDAGGTPLTAIDRDFDLVLDRNDIDSDNDGVPDTIESGALDFDRNGRVDLFSDGNSNGLIDLLDPTAFIPGTPLFDIDSDRDLVLDRNDIDSDNDGVPDTVESGAFDFDRNGRIDLFSDVNRNGLADRHDPAAPTPGTPLVELDNDGDFVFDRNDVDTDNDGIPDTVEAAYPDANRDGRIDFFNDFNRNGLADFIDPAAIPAGRPNPGIDVDSDFITNRLDVDSDNDGITDVVEAGGPAPGPDTDGDGRIDGFTDANRNGLADFVDPTANPPGVPLILANTDGTGAPDFLDLDSDADGLTDMQEGHSPVVLASGSDTDRNGLDDAWDPGFSGPPAGVPANLPDTDLNGVPDWRDASSSCVVANTPPVETLFVVESFGADVTLSWTAVSNAESYNVWYVFGDSGSSNKSSIPDARGSGPWPNVTGCFQSAALTCSHVGAIAGIDLDIHHYQVRGVCGTTEAAE